ncbi:Tetratricopeptide repeat protein [Aquisphaera giovannonii]|uniref:Tetratricopeptide repeat protein n=1 Tax=Aquisphaera giovannonii TaxID=406548 RepID=A0A5B9W3U2_9BACT|nr:tetratricopeptide repeat protein [Aquisphaera giovannonii]QEH35286.1 Tetratricopeptide repeat protein [Aquisphaera giovannonii]
MAGESADLAPAGGTPGVRVRIFLAALIALAGGGALAFSFWHAATPDLAEICALARRGEFDRAEALLSDRLRDDPGDPKAHLLMAQFSMDRPDPRPEAALEHLGRLRPKTREEEALLRFSEGKARYQLKEYGAAEALWYRALELDPRVPEAGWALLDLLDFEGRNDEAHELGMRLFEHEPHPRDRVRLLLEMVRMEVEHIDNGSRVQTFEPAWKADPSNLRLGMAVGFALLRSGEADRGLEVLKGLLDRNPDSPQARETWLAALMDAHRPEQLKAEVARLPGALREDPRFARFLGAVADGDRDWPTAIRMYRRALEFRPYDGATLYRLRLAARASGDAEELRRADDRLRDFKDAESRLADARKEAMDEPTLGVTPRPALYHKLASLRERVGRLDEARAWHRLVLRDAPGDPTSLAALERLK